MSDYYDPAEDPEVVHPSHFGLGEVIAFLEQQPPDKVLPIGFGEPDSFRGYYEQLAFAPAKDVTIGSMLAHARSALGTTYEGYKGGDYTMNEHTDCWISHVGRSDGETLGRILLTLMVSQATP